MTNKKDNINPSHYRQYPLESIGMLERIWGLEATITFCVMTAFKYRMRFGHKDDVQQELQKEKWYLDKAEELRQKLFNTSSSEKDATEKTKEDLLEGEVSTVWCMTLLMDLTSAEEHDDLKHEFIGTLLASTNRGHIVPKEIVEWAKNSGLNPKLHAEDKTTWWTVTSIGGLGKPVPPKHLAHFQQIYNSLDPKEILYREKASLIQSISRLGYTGYRYALDKNLKTWAKKVGLQVEPTKYKNAGKQTTTYAVIVEY